MSNPLLDQLKSPDPVQRRKAIVAIANSKDPAMLKPLGVVYKTDPDPQVRELALKAGKYIQSTKQAPPPPPRQPEPEPEPSSNYYNTPPSSSSGPDLYGGAYPSGGGSYSPGGYSTDNSGYAAGSDASASFFGAAAAGAGSGGYDPGAGNMFGAYSGTPAAMAIPQTPMVKGEKMVTIIDVLIDLALYAVIIAVALTAFLVVGSKVFFAELKDDLFKNSQQNTSTTYTDEYGNTIEDPYASPTVEMFTEEDYEALMDISVVGSLIAGLSIGLSSCISIVFDCLGMHIAATSILGGRGPLVDFMHKYIPFMTYTILIAAIISVTGFILMTVSFAFATILLMVLGAGFLVWVFWSMWLVGRSYELGSFYGCITIFIGIIFAGIISSIFNCMFSSVSALPF